MKIVFIIIVALFAFGCSSNKNIDAAATSSSLDDHSHNCVDGGSTKDDGGPCSDDDDHEADAAHKHCNSDAGNKGKGEDCDEDDSDDDDHDRDASRSDGDCK